MRRALLLVAALLGACSMFKGSMETPALAVVAPAASQAAADGAPIERVPFRIGVSSATVEKLAREHACRSGQGAGLVTEPGPIEVYRVRCDDGKVFMARCELRQCRKM